MSDQFWVSIDLRYLKNHAKHKPHEVCVLFEKTFDMRQLGKTHQIMETSSSFSHNDLQVEAEEYNSENKQWTTLVVSKERLSG